MTSATPTTFVLLHGAGLGSWCWQAVTPRLELPALAVDLPGRGDAPCELRTATRATYVDTVVAAISRANPARCILVAHSFTGSIAHLIAAALPGRIAHIIFLAATVPAPGRSVLDTFTLIGRTQLRLVMMMVRAGVSFPRWVWQMGMRTSFTELDPATRRMAFERLMMPEAPAMFLQPLDRSSWPAVPCSYITLTRDRCPLPPARQALVIAGLPGVAVYTLATGHSAMLSAPDELAALLNTIARSYGSPQDHSTADRPGAVRVTPISAGVPK
jgi:pimeloyl-ACP methyl ester carboxylesterase